MYVPLRARLSWMGGCLGSRAVLGLGVVLSRPC